jgi:SAM-dependent methyltransferase
LAYESYFTHAAVRPLARPGLKAAFARRIRVVRDVGTDHYIARRFGYADVGPPWRHIASVTVRLWPGRRLDAEFTVMRLQGKEVGRVLDVGCGRGDALVALRDRGWQVRGVDFDPDSVAVARARGLPVDIGSLPSQGYADESFDVVTMSHSLEHLPDPAGVLSEVRRILRPGGRLVVVTPNAASWLHQRYGADWQPLEPPRHLQIFTPHALSDLARRAGLVEIEVVTTPRSANGVARAAWKFRRNGHWDMESRPSLPERVVMEAIQLWEGWRVWAHAECGEEIVLTARRPDAPPYSGPR